MKQNQALNGKNYSFSNFNLNESGNFQIEIFRMVKYELELFKIDTIRY